MDAGPGVAFTAGAGDAQVFNFFPIFKGDAVDLTIAAHVDFHALRQGVDDRNPHPMQAAGELVVFIRKLPARVQPTKNQLNRRNPFFRVDINRHPAPVVDNLQRLIGMEDDFHAFGVAGQCFIHTVINNFLTKMVRTGCVGVHSRAAANRLKPGEYLNGISVI